MTRRIVTIAGMLASLIVVPETVRAQRLIDRFAPSMELVAASPAAEVSADSSGRSTYWLEGAGLGAVAGVVAAIVSIDTQGACTTGVPGWCETTYAPRIIGSVLMGVTGAFVGGMLGASISRGEDAAAPELPRKRRR